MAASNHPHYGNHQQECFLRTLKWPLLLSLLLLSLQDQVQAFSPSLKTTTLLSRAISPAKPSSFQVHSPSRLFVSSADVASADEISTENFDFEALRGPDGVYKIETGDQHRAFLKEHSDKLVILKVFAPWCRACKALEPKYQQVANDKTNKNLPILFTQMSIQNNKDYIKSIGVLALPTVQFYKNGQLVDNFPCGPSKVPIFKRKLGDLIERSVDPTTNLVKGAGTVTAEPPLPAAPSTSQPPPTATQQQPQTVPPPEEHQYLTAEQTQHMRTSVPFFETLSDAEFDSALEKAKILTFDSGSVIMREGNFGRTFYVMLEGEVEICQRTAFEDPMIAPTDYIGTVINRLTAGDYFGERALITGEPRAASIRVTEPMRCVAFAKEDLPASCVLAGLPSARESAMVDQVNEKYGVSMRELDEMETSQQIMEASLVNQKRGSALTPQVIPGVDTDDDVSEYFSEESVSSGEEDDDSLAILKRKTESIVPLLEKFKLIQLISRCFDYIVASGAKWGDPAVRRRRSLLVSQLPKSQREEFVEAFQLIDSNGDGGISMEELKRVMESIGEEKSDDDLKEMIPPTTVTATAATTTTQQQQMMTLQDFVGIMAEVEFYYLFRDVFASLDKRGAGFVKAGELDRVLCGVRDLISDDRHSIIDVEDKDMAIDYEMFTRMLLGLSL